MASSVLRRMFGHHFGRLPPATPRLQPRAPPRSPYALPFPTLPPTMKQRLPNIFFSKTSARSESTSRMRLIMLVVGGQRRLHVARIGLVPECTRCPGRRVNHESDRLACNDRLEGRGFLRRRLPPLHAGDSHAHAAAIRTGSIRFTKAAVGRNRVHPVHKSRGGSLPRASRKYVDLNSWTVWHTPLGRWPCATCPNAARSPGTRRSKTTQWEDIRISD